MTLLLPFGLAVVINATVLGVGLVCFKRQAKCVVIERAAQRRGMYQLEPLPPPGDEVLILVEEDDGRTSEITAVHWPQLGWTDAVTLLRVEDEVLGWRRHPFRREPPPVDYTDWTREEIAAEMERRFGQAAEQAGLRPFGTRTGQRDGC